MIRFTSTMCAIAMAIPLFAVSPAISAPAKLSIPLAAKSSSTNIIDVQYRRNHHNYRSHHNHYRPRHYRHRHSGGDVAAGVIGGLAAGVILGGIANSQAQSVPPRNYHVEWCLNRYRSYDIRTNTFQPYNGPRQFCNSPHR